MDNVNLEELNEKCKEFAELEKRGTFYDMAISLINNGFDIEAFFLILATWNFATFRYAVKEFDINTFKDVLKKQCDPIFNQLKNMSLETINYNEINVEIKELYNTLSSIKGVKYTGASKLMHLKNPKLFIMWDGFIRKEYGFKKGTAENYINFLKKMQEIFSDINWNHLHKTLAKAIDEYNYMRITYPKLTRNKNSNQKEK